MTVGYLFTTVIFYSNPIVSVGFLATYKSDQPTNLCNTQKNETIPKKTNSYKIA
ncbi:hypothetical protein [Enterococcus faecium]|uniref:hypothetical protein n=1 Tax=Enterococcus faecium TaxID=1352 RepID=UPI0038B4B2E0